MRIGGPYTIEVSYIGFNKSTTTDIVLQLGQPFILKAVLSEGGVQLEAVSIKSTKRIVTAKSGASTNISSKQLSTLPTFSRSITDFTRLTPQSKRNKFCRS